MAGKIETFGEIPVGSVFRWIGGFTEFIKLDDSTASVRYNDTIVTHPMHYEKVILTGEIVK